MAFGESVENTASYYNPGAEVSSVVRDTEESIQALYYNYYTGNYYNDGQTIAAIIILDIILPIACCVGMIITIVCVVRAMQRRRHREANLHHTTQVHYVQG